MGILGSPTLETVLQVCQQCWAVWKNHLPLAGSVLSNAAHALTVILCCKGTLLAYAQLNVQQSHRPFSGKEISGWMTLSLPTSMILRSSDAGVWAPVSWTWYSCWPISSTCRGPSEWWFTHLVYQYFPPIFYHLAEDTLASMIIKEVDKLNQTCYHSLQFAVSDFMLPIISLWQSRDLSAFTPHKCSLTWSPIYQFISENVTGKCF